VAEVILLVVALILAASTLPGSLELLLVTSGAILRPRRSPDAAAYRGHLTVVVPAHNEELSIARCVASLRACVDEDVPFAIVVVADNCDDATAERARAAGARVLERYEDTHRGKGHALQLAFDTLLPEGVDAVAVVDADSVVDAGFIHELRRELGGGADAVQARYGLLDPHASAYSRLQNLAFLAMNVVRPRGRDRWNLSAGILGNGFALTRDTLLAVPWTAVSLVEDLEYHLKLVRGGRSVRFADRTWVRAAAPGDARAAAVQTARWEGGRFRLILDQLPALAADLLRGRWRMLEAALDLLLLPLTWHSGLLLLLAALPVNVTRLYALVALGLVALHLLTALALGGGTWRDLASLLLAPFHALRKLSQVPAIVRSARRHAAWQRTPRSAAGEGRGSRKDG
jgi:cellulose synthase/poly-beta-1,6-N-acetylglucosamine synthase-like glycosyltransferase